MADLLTEDLRAEAAKGHLVAVVGAGVSMGATGDDPVASWTGLLEAGVERCEALHPALASGGWGDDVRARIASRTADDLLWAAGEVTDGLGGRSNGEYRRWLKDTVGGLRARDRAVLEALRDLRVPLATTNYDGLLEEVTGLEPVTWRDGAQMQAVLRGDEEGVLHLHGHWEDPESVVLGVGSYEAVLGDAPTQALLRAAAVLRTFILVGFGAGLDDPNFGALRRWMCEAIRGSEYRHFRLARASDVAWADDQHHPDERVAVVSYGPDYADLAPFLAGLGAALAASAPPPAPSAAPLPPPPRPFGRESLVEDVVGALLADAPPPTLVLGPPGIGKSTVCLTALHDLRVAARYGERRHFVRWDGAETAEAALAGIAAALGLAPGPNLRSRVLRELERAPTALVLDNVDTPWTAEALPTEELLAAVAGAAGVAVVASLRGSERPGGAPWREPVVVPPLAPDDARLLFLAVAGQRYAEDSELEGLLGPLGGVPLAVELLAYAAPGEPGLAALARRWQEEGGANLLRRAGGGDARTSAAASFELSISGARMTEEARRLLFLLGVLPDGVAHEDLDELLPGTGRAAASTLRKVGLAFDEGDRLRTLPPIRDHVGAEHPPRPEDLDRAVAHYVALARALGGVPGDVGGAEAARRLVAENGNVDAMVLEGLRSASDSPLRDAVEAAIALANFARHTGVGSTSLQETAYQSAVQLGDATLQADVLRALGHVAVARSRYDKAVRYYEQARALFGQAGRANGEATCVFALGEVAQCRGQLVVAQTYFLEALPIFIDAGDAVGQANCVTALGTVALRHGELDQARTWLQEARSLYRQAHHVLGEATTLGRLGEVALRSSDLDQGEAYYREALPLFRAVGDVLGEAHCTRAFGSVAFLRADQSEDPTHHREEARAHFEAALRLYRQVGGLEGEANSLRGLGELAGASDQPEQAQAFFEAALALHEQVPDFGWIGHLRVRLARLAHSEDERRRHVRAAREAWGRVDDADLVRLLDEEFGND